MALHQPDVQQFVVVGQQNRIELEGNKLFKDYFSDKQDQLSFIEDVDDQTLVKYHQNLERALFIVQHFDIDPAHQITNGTANNNNHIFNSRLKRLVEEESEVDSVGYTTDCDDIDEEESMQIESSPEYDSGQIFNKLTALNCCIMGSIALLQKIQTAPKAAIQMVSKERPLHNLAMQDVLITFSGVSSRQEAQQLLTLTRYMGAKSREEVTNKTTHLVAGNLRGGKYRRAVELGLSIMSTTWVRESFRLAQRDLEFKANMPEIIQLYKLKPFYDLHLAFAGFKEEDVNELRELTIANEGYTVEVDDPSCTHIVLDAVSGSDTTRLLSNLNWTANAYVVYTEWFWASLEMEGKVNEDPHAVPGFKPQTRRLSRMHRSSTSGHNLLSPNLDYSRSPDSMSRSLDRQLSKTQSVNVTLQEEPDLSKISARHQICLELLQTERNYVKILHTIVTLFKVPLEKLETSDPILPATEVKIIFGNLTPIYEVHKRMLDTLEDQIERDWNETNCIGRVFLKHSIDLLKAYPPFVNFFEDTKKTINSCDSNYPRFHAFLKRCQSSSECNRESLTEMLIRPVQRLPSISLIITELMRKTDESNADKKHLEEALESIRRVMNLINEDKRKTEGQIAMFDIVNNIEDCPPNLLSALRRFVCKAEARLLFMNNESEIIPSKSHKVVLFIFSDLIEICKIRSLKRPHSFRGSRTYVPIRRGINAAQAQKLHNKKDYRHLDELRLCDIIKIYKNCESPEMSDALVLQARPTAKYEYFRFYPLIIDDEVATKKSVAERLEECICTSDDPKMISEYVPSEKSITNEEIDFGYANLLVNCMGKSRLSRVLSMRQSLLSPSLKSQRNLHSHYHNN